MTSAAGTGDDTSDRNEVEVVVLEARAVDEMVGKIRAASDAPSAADAVAAWRAEHPRADATPEGHDHAVVGQTLMYLHDAPDGMLVPHAVYPDGTEKIYTDAAHADAVY